MNEDETVCLDEDAPAAVSGRSNFKFVQEGPCAEFGERKCPSLSDRGIKGRFHIHDLKLMADGEFFNVGPSFQRRDAKLRVFLKATAFAQQNKGFTG
jgi:hypothetical protein